jgi:hypothetical protein
MESAAWFERNIRGAIEEMLARTDPGSTGQLYVNNQIGNVESYWRLYLIKHGRGDLLGRTRFFLPATLDLQEVPAGALILSSVEDAWQKEKVASGEIEPVFTAREPDGAASYLVLRRSSARAALERRPAEKLGGNALPDHVVAEVGPVDPVGRVLRIAQVD